MRFFNIEKGSVKTVIDEMQFEKIYKPQGWKVVNDAETGELINNINAEGKINGKITYVRLTIRRKQGQNNENKIT